MPRFAVFAFALLALLLTVTAAHAAGDKGTISRSWISVSSGGDSQKSFSAGKVKRLYANFIWNKPAKAGQVLRIEWHDPAGALRAVWKDKTISDDKKGTRLYAWIGTGVVKGKLGSWSAVLTVAGERISAHKFRVVA